MGKIVYLMGKSSTGKDTIYKHLAEEMSDRLRCVVSYTTRPIRIREKDGEEYFFTDEAGFQSLLADGKVIEHRAYHTCHGLWRYFTVDDGQIALAEQDYLCIGTLESYESIQAYFGKDRMLPVLIELDDGVRLQRALDRERKQREPRYEEMCRRFLADSEDFSEERIAHAGITRRFVNDDLKSCMEEIRSYLRENL